MKNHGLRGLEWEGVITPEFRTPVPSIAKTSQYKGWKELLNKGRLVTLKVIGALQAKTTRGQGTHKLAEKKRECLLSLDKLKPEQKKTAKFCWY